MPYKDTEKQRNYNRVWATAQKKEFLQSKCCAVCHGFENLRMYSTVKGARINKLRPWSRNVSSDSYIVMCTSCKRASTHPKQRPVTTSPPVQTKVAPAIPIEKKQWALALPTPEQVIAAEQLGKKLMNDQQFSIGVTDAHPTN